MSSRNKALKAAKVKDLFPLQDPNELRHLARRATAVPAKSKRALARTACRGKVAVED